MTSFWAIFKEMSRTKFRGMNQLLLLELAATAVSAIWIAIKGNFTSATLFYSVAGWSVLPYFIAFVMLSVSNERAFRQDTFRLVPISNLKFYAVNILSTLANFIYLLLAQVVLSVVTALIGWSHLSTYYDTLLVYQSAANLLWYGLGTLVTVLVLYLLAWSTISLVHLITSAASNFLPSARQRLVNVIVYIVVIFLTFRIVSFVMHQVATVSQTLLGSSGSSQWLVGLLVMVIIIALETAANIFLLHKWVETAAN
ncbi:ABC transporter permease [Lactobacillus sp. CBA3606]|uniref:ABC transporter permease n=1 Tax=unclassified Lactobacillus TaxID=2620435 RepID=UPI000CFC149C|nr:MULTISPECIES: ABC transporter permease [unclassified Lactobacillus]AVK60916.1 ABC transporter permease [Lactobacillus sp. CBA3605]AVK63514.1 ABC transporter permease [Lactobacillus sp. CBA3606]